MQIRRRQSGTSVIRFAFTIVPQVSGEVVEPYATVPASSDALLEFQVFDPSGAVFLGTLTRRALGSSFSEDLNGPGAGNLSIHASDPALMVRRSILADRNIVKVVLDGQVVYAWRVQGGESVLVDRNEDAGRVISMAGPGVLEVLKDGILRPEWPIGGEPTKSSGERRFGYMSQADTNLPEGLATSQPPWFSESGWSQSRFTIVPKKDIKSGPAIVFPERWPDKDAGLVWPSNPNDPAAPGTVYWRGEFTLGSKTRLGVYASADDILELYLDGVRIMEDGEYGDSSYTRTSEWTGLLDAGPHLIAAKTTNLNIQHFSGNWAFFICSVMKVDDQGVPQMPAIFHTQRSGWRTYWSGVATIPFTDVTKTDPKSVGGTTVGGKYTVVAGDTMIKIGAKFGMDWRTIYEANKSLIDNDPRIASLPTRPPAWWIFPGTALTIPGGGTTAGSGATQTTSSRVWRAGVPLTTPSPGWYPYQILAKVVREAQYRGVEALKSVALGFEGGKDSSGDYWPTGSDTRHERSFPLGSTVYQVTQDLIESGMDVRMTPDLILNAYLKMGTYRGLGSTAPFRLYDAGSTTYSYRVRRTASIVNDLLVDTDDGWRNYLEDSSITEHGRTEGNLSLGGTEPDKLAQAVGSELEELARPKKTIETSWRYQEGRRPYIDFDLGDTVVAINELGIEFDVRITSFGVSEDAENELTVSVEASGEDYS